MPPFKPNWAFFLDIDGTLLEIAVTPKAVHTARADCRLVAALYDKAGGALALVSGRSLNMIDELFSPMKLPAAGQHGVERRDARGRVQHPSFPAELLARAAEPLRSFAARHDGLVFEDKGYSMALHYRLAPRLAAPRPGAARRSSGPRGSACPLAGHRLCERGGDARPADERRSDRQGRHRWPGGARPRRIRVPAQRRGEPRCPARAHGRHQRELALIAAR